MGEEDFEYILNAIEFLAVYGQRFLPLYSFNLRNGSWRMKTEEFEALTKESNCNDVQAGRDYSFAVKQDGDLSRNELYFDAAKFVAIASKLPKFPSEGILQGNVDPNILCFRV